MRVNIYLVAGKASGVANIVRRVMQCGCLHMADDKHDAKAKNCCK
jgi:hypothetical protein